MLKQKKTKGKRKVQGVPQSQIAALPRHQEEEETDKSEQAQIEKNVRKALRFALSSPSEVIAMLKGLKENQQLDSGGPDQSQSIRHQPTYFRPKPL